MNAANGEEHDPATSTTLAAACAVALVSFLPFARGVFAGHAFFFRDLSAQFFPLRQLVVEGLRQGELRFWNPYTHEGVPLTLLPLGYPLDLLQVLWPDDAGLSRLLALHVPLAALSFLALGRGLRLSLAASAGGALAYALGGFCLSTLNLYVYLQAMAWAPLIVLGLAKAATGAWRHVALAGVVLAVGLSTTGIEVVLQAIAFGMVLGWPTSWSGIRRQATAVLLGTALAAAVLVPTAAQVGGSTREAGFTTDVVLAHSVHPVTFLQVIVPGLYGDLANLPERFWGQNFFPRGFPYILSLYLGVTVLALAATGLAERSPLALRLGALGALAIIACLGRWAGFEPLLDSAPMLRKLRYPTKAFFTVHAAASLLAALGLQALAANRQRSWARLVGLTALGGALPMAVALAVAIRPATLQPVLAAFFPPGFSWPERLHAASWVAMDTAAAMLPAVCAGALGLLVRARRLAPGRAALAVVALLAADLLRAGAGLNAMVSPAFFALSPPAASLARAVRSEGGRLFTFDPSVSPAYFRARDERPASHEVWTFRVLRETFTPEFNVGPRISTALSLDRTMLVPVDRVLDPTEARPAELPRLLTRLRRAGVRFLLSLEPIEHPDLEGTSFGSAPELLPLVVHAYRLRDPWPRYSVEPAPSSDAAEHRPPSVGSVEWSRESSDRMELSVAASRPAVLVVRDAWAPGWNARVDDKAVPIVRVEGGHRAVAVPSGRSRVALEYRPPGWTLGLWVTAVSGLLAAWLGLTADRAYR